MSRYSRFSKNAKSGAVDSKYFGNTNKFEEDVTIKMQKTNEFKKHIRELILKEPDKMEQRVGNIIEVLKEIKEEFKI
ncbi:hypothetical protein I3900191A7_16200 [Clostridium baratii]|uniref:hypothetical protein n=1 Tax=Clostridium baratii TaxID=1561 RepID=UPI0036F2BC56